jgi:hypothetical protein
MAIDTLIAYAGVYDDVATPRPTTSWSRTCTATRA